MNHGSKFGILAGVITLSALAASPATASPENQDAARSALSADASGANAPEGYFIPGPDTIVKRDSSPQPAPADSGISAKGTTYKVTAGASSESCGTTKIQKTSGAGKTTLVLTVEESVEAEVSTEVKVDAEVVSAGVGFSTTRKYGVSDQTRYEVPKGKHGTIEAYPLYDNYPIKIYKNGKKAGAGTVLKPVGVCFNQWSE
ncbi:hypothetical protein AB0Q95_44770 [Streptomyces sp. NPDC059900]|uniref:hypothetical protein n=1 Tax=Streptomyces sp. NPDC059900 TaxID=3155816 RepID=UPI0034403148